MKTLWLAVFSVVAVLLVSPEAILCQSDEIPARVNDQNRTGDLPFSSYVGSDIEKVDIATGALHVRIPIAHVKGRGPDYDFHLYYDSNMYVLALRTDPFLGTYHQWTLDRNYSALLTGLPGWGKSVPYWTLTTGTFPCQNGTQTYRQSYIYHDEDNGKHPLAVQMSVGGSCPMNDLTGPDLAAQGMWGTTPGSLAATAYDANGMLFTPSGTNVTSEKDSNGNITGWGPGVQDSLGRTLVTEQAPTNQRIYTVSDSNGTPQTYTVNLDLTYPINTNFPDEAGSGSGVLKQYKGGGAVSSIVLPNGKSYVFKYDQPNPTYSYGNIVEIDLPTGAVITYSWGTFINPDFSYSRKVTDRTVTVGGQVYHWNFNGGTVTDPAGNQSVYTVIEGTITNAKFYQGGASGNPIRQYQMTYQDDASDPLHDPYAPSPDPEVTQYLPGRRLTSITTTLDDGRVSKTEYDYETFNYTYHPNHDGTLGHYSQQVTFTTSRGNVTEIREYDYGAVPGTYGQGTPGPLLRKTDKTYLHNSNTNYLTYNIVSKVLTNTIYDGPSGTQMAQTQYEYDGTALQSTSGVPQHDYTNYSSTFTYRGNASKVKRWRNTDGILLSTTYNYDDLGNIKSISDPLGHTGNYDYTDSWSGTGCPPPSNSQAYVTTFTNPVNLQTKITYFPCTGLVQAHKDQNDITAGRAGTTYLYDLLGRVTQKSLSDGGQVNNSYTDTPPVSVATTTKITSSMNLSSTTVKDGLGRVSQTQLTDPDCTAGLVKADYVYDYDAINHLRFDKVSTPYCNTPDATYGLFAVTNHGVIDRVSSVVQTDLSTVSSTYAGNCTTVTDEAGKSRKSCADGLGRMTQVFEGPSLNYETDYQYDVLGNLLRVDQKGGDSNPANWRTRTLTYNSLSQLLTANNPESGTITYTYYDDGTENTKVAPKPNQAGSLTVTTTYSYDAGHRVTQKSYSDGTATVKFGYDGVALTGCTPGPPALSDNNSKGYRTAMCDGSGATSWSHDPLGRVLTEKRQITGASAKPVSYTYNLDGSLATLTYAGTGKVITYTYNAAAHALTAKDVGGAINYVTAATYAPPGGLSGLQNGASVFARFTYNSRLQPLQLFYTTGTVPPISDLQQTGCPSTIGTILHRAYNFGAGTNDNGNVLSITNCRDNNRTQNFQYDSMNRITQGYTTGTNWGEDFTIDAWGNLTNRSLHAGKTNYELLNAAPASGKNQLPGFGYDAAGNMTSNGSATYTYDAENRLTATAGWTYVYDGDGKRVKKVNGSAGTLYWMGTGNDPLAENSLTGANLEEYIFFNGKRVARRDVTGNVVHYYFADTWGQPASLPATWV